jgi:hypothetical protein
MGNHSMAKRLLKEGIKIKDINALMQMVTVNYKFKSQKDYIMSVELLYNIQKQMINTLKMYEKLLA